MLKFIIQAASLSFVALLFGSCESAPLEESNDFIAIESLFSDAPSFNGNLICSSGFAKIGEGISVYPDKYDNIKNPYEIAVLLDFRNAQRSKPYSLKTNQQISFCGEVNLQAGCWRISNPNISGPNCIPFNKPIRIKVDEFSF